LSLIDPASLSRSVDVVLRILGAIERERRLVNLSPRGEPQLGKRGLYRAGQRAGQAADSHLALLWVLNQSDGSRGLLEIAQRAGLPFEAIDEAAVALEQAGLVREAPHDGESDSWRSRR
jgi:aminopeptidase-like protein